MDEKLSKLIAEVNQQIDPKSISDGAFFFRQIHKNNLKKKHVPSTSCFSYSPKHENDGLSVDWSELSTPELSLAIAGKTYKVATEEYKKPADYLIYKIEKAYLSNLAEIKQTRHDPKFYGNPPPPPGKPNNPAHTVIIYFDPNDPEIRVKLQNHACNVELNFGLIEKIADELEKT